MSTADSTALSNMPEGGLIVAVDGPSGAGKSTVCRRIASMLGAKYLDTGAMYRVATLHVLRQGINPSDTTAVVQATRELPLSVNDDPASREVILDGEDVSNEIRGRLVTQNVSAVAAILEVRENLVALQRELVATAHRCVVDGRDIGSTVLVDAPVKIFLTASAEVRAQRRYDQDVAAGRLTDLATVLADVKRRDELDSNRSVSPLAPASDATVVDTSTLTLDQVVDTLMTLIEKSAERTAR
ncbi:(d)CMP kinase [Corynebacterium diphtheriae]|uniref:Cytidylate kinase n=1 Tax=Corynebacterium diphtheriae bv. gravis TaxID=1720349 RepID=A0AAX0J2D3_CORDP|nr:(d)CMP kinase [Corynebacterium diphtheriae]ERA55896.1 cytidylate kinase [Corynebacterium diphtheriae DSM 43988]AEX67389.1 cytidylate kinase [Corynebacterium diphtheriae C7 (beta)]OIS01518.1 cytidylate kinase [Corynebacterium diphtheriae]OKY23488.1 cytidylate kinase [Corynebacterium diphtheriae bv. gravis]UEB35755.1 (d)CMP kinase [Corynebacterium diphtheriae subsp. diphtheriae]